MESFAQVAWGNKPDMECIGEIIDLFTHTHMYDKQPVKVTFAKVCWYIDTADGFSEHVVLLWQHEVWITIL